MESGEREALCGRVHLIRGATSRGYQQYYSSHPFPWSLGRGFHMPNAQNHLSPISCLLYFSLLIDTKRVEYKYKLEARS